MENIDGKMDLNTIGVEELISLGVPGLKARRILEYRQWHGCFRSVKELLDVRGIGNATFAKLEPNVRVSVPEALRDPFERMSRAEIALLGLECCEKHICAVCPYFAWFYKQEFGERQCIVRNRNDAKELLRALCAREESESTDA